MAEKPRFTQDYAITITLNPRIRDISTVSQHDRMYSIDMMIRDRIREYFGNPKNLTMPKITLISELTKSQDVHYHGIICFPLSYKLVCPIMFMRNLFRERYKGNPNKMEPKHYIGFMCIKPLEHYDEWLRYISKDLKEYHRKVKRIPIVRDDYEVFQTEELLGMFNDIPSS